MTNAMPLVLSGLKEKSLSNRTELIKTAVLCLCLLLAVAATAQQREITESTGSEPSFTTFEAPGAGTGASQGTIPFSINTAGAVTGTITTFDAPGAGTGAAQGTVSFSINSAGDIAGTYVDASYVYHGFG